MGQNRPTSFMMKNKTLDLTKGNTITVLVYFVLPILLGSLIQQLYVTADAVIVGQFVGKNGLAAIDSVHTLFKFPLNFMSGLSTGATILISGYFGAKDRDGIHCSIRTTFTIAMVLGVFCSVAGVILTPFFLNLMAVPDEIYTQTAIYTIIYFGGIWAMVLYNMESGILRALGDSKRPLYVLIFCSLINIAGDLLLVCIFHMGVAGAATATVLAQILSAWYTLRLVAEAEREGGQKRIWHLHFCKEHMTIMIKTGLPLALQSMFFPVANSIVQASVNTMGVNQIAAWGLCDKLDMLIWLVADAMAPALTTFTAQNIGAGKYDRVKKGVFVGTAMSTICCIMISIVLFFGTPIMGKWFLTSSDAGVIVPLASGYMRLLAPFFFFYAIAEALSGACSSMGDTLKPMLVTLTCMCVLRIVGIIFVFPLHHTMECIAFIYIASWVVTATAFVLMFVIRLRMLEIKKNKKRAFIF